MSRKGCRSQNSVYKYTKYAVTLLEKMQKLNLWLEQKISSYLLDCLTLAWTISVLAEIMQDAMEGPSVSLKILYSREKVTQASEESIKVTKFLLVLQFAITNAWDNTLRLCFVSRHVNLHTLIKYPKKDYDFTLMLYSLYILHMLQNVFTTITAWSIFEWIIEEVLK